MKNPWFRPSSRFADQVHSKRFWDPSDSWRTEVDSFSSPHKTPKSTLILTLNVHQCHNLELIKLMLNVYNITQVVLSLLLLISPAFINLSLGHLEAVWEWNVKPAECFSQINLMGFLGGGFSSNQDMFRAKILVAGEGFTFNSVQLSGWCSFPTLLRFCHKLGSILGTLLQLGEVWVKFFSTSHGGDLCETTDGSVSATFTMCLYAI